MTWFGFAGFSSSQGYALRACQAKLQDYRIQLKQKAAGLPKMTKKLRPILNRAKKAWEAVIRGLSLLPGESDGSQIMVLEYAFLSSRQFGRMYCGCNNACCKDAFGSSGPLKFKLADPTQGLRGVVVRAEVVFNIIKLQQYLNTQFLDVLFLREMGVALGIGSMWQFKGIAYEEHPDTRNTLSKLYASSGPATGGLFLPTEGISSHGVYQLTNDWRRFPLPKPVSGPPNFDIGYDKDVMRVTLLRNSWIGPQSVGFLYDLGFTVDYSAAGKFSPWSARLIREVCLLLVDACNSNSEKCRVLPWPSVKLSVSFYLECRPQDRDGTIRVIPGRGFSTLGLDAELKEDAVGAINPAETPCNSNRDCVSGICVTTILGFLQSNGYDLESQSVDGFSPKALSTETDAFPQYNFIIEEARQKWQSIIRGIARPLRGNRVPGDLEIKFDFFNENSNTLGSAGPQEVDFYDSIDGSYFLTRRGGMKFNARFLENNLIDLDTFKAVVLHEMGHILLIGLWDLLTTFAECQVESKFTDAYLDGAGNAAMGHYLLSKQWTKAIKTPLRLYRTPSLTAPGSDCGHWDERLLDNELMTPFTIFYRCLRQPELEVAMEPVAVEADSTPVSALRVPPLTNLSQVSRGSRIRSVTPTNSAKSEGGLQNALMGVEERLSAQIARVQQQGDRLREVALSRMDAKVSTVEALQPKFDRRMAELSGSVKGLSDEMQSQLRRVDQIDTKLWDWRHQIEEELRVRLVEVEQSLQQLGSAHRVAKAAAEDSAKKLSMRMLRLEARVLEAHSNTMGYSGGFAFRCQENHGLHHVQHDDAINAHMEHTRAREADWQVLQSELEQRCLEQSLTTQAGVVAGAWQGNDRNGIAVRASQ
eukprot:g23637.t1